MIDRFVIVSPHGPASTDETETGDVQDFGLGPFDPDELIRSSSFCAMVHASNQLGHEIAPALSEVKLTPTLCLALGQILAAPGSTPAELARRCAFLPQTMGAVLQTLEERELIVRDGERGRGRSTRVSITQAGVDLLLACWPIVHGAGGERLSDGQHLILQELLEQIRGGSGAPDDVVILVDDQGRDVGTHPRATVHTSGTPLHRAFSTYLLDDEGRVLMTRRALHKRTWPGVWTNSACGHLRPGEDAAEAATRRVPDELGVTPRDLRVVLPEFRYRAVDASGIVEHEICPVMVGRIDPADLDTNPSEVAEHAWVTWEQLRSTAEHTPFALSPWCVEQVGEMAGLNESSERPW